MLKLLLDAVFPMRKQHRQQILPATAADNIHALDNHFAQALTCTHDIGGVYGFIGTDQNELLRSVF